MNIFFGRRGSKDGSSLKPPDHCEISRDDLSILAREFRKNVKEASLNEPKLAYQEFTRKTKEANPTTVASLNFSRCGLNDGHVQCLLRALAQGPCISSINLSDNEISNISADIILKLLTGQMDNLIKKATVDERMHESFLGEVVLSDSVTPIADDKLFEITARTECIRWINARSNIRRMYHVIKCPSLISEEEFRKMWSSVIRNPAKSDLNIDEEWIHAALERAEYSSNKLTYKEAEHAILGACQAKGLLPKLEPWQAEEIEEEHAEADNATNVDIANDDTFEASPAEATHTDERNEVVAQIYAFYKEHNPAKLSELPNLLAKYQGRETVMLQNLHKKYLKGGQGNTNGNQESKNDDDNDGFAPSSATAASAFNEFATEGGQGGTDDAFTAFDFDDSGPQGAHPGDRSGPEVKQAKGTLKPHSVEKREEFHSSMIRDDTNASAKYDTQHFVHASHDAINKAQEAHLRQETTASRNLLTGTAAKVYKQQHGGGHSAGKMESEYEKSKIDHTRDPTPLLSSGHSPKKPVKSGSKGTSEQKEGESPPGGLPLTEESEAYHQQQQLRLELQQQQAVEFERSQSGNNRSVPSLLLCIYYY